MSYLFSTATTTNSKSSTIVYHVTTFQPEGGINVKDSGVKC